MTKRREQPIFTEEVKSRLLPLYNTGKSIAEILREYDLSLTAFDSWVKCINDSGSTKEKANRTLDGVYTS